MRVGEVLKRTAIEVTNYSEHNVDGDAMNGIFIKEMGEVIKFMNMHPMCTMIGTSLSINSNVELVDRRSLHNWLNEFDTEVEWL